MIKKLLKKHKQFLLILISLFIFLPGTARATPGALENLMKLIGEEIAACISNPVACALNLLAYRITLFPRLVAFIFALLGFILAVVAIYLGWAIVPAFANSLIKISLDMSVYKGISNTWNSVKDFSLGLIEIFLLIIGLLTIFRIREYEARKTLISLVVAALLISFSLAIGEKLIELGNDLTIYVANNFFDIQTGTNNYFPDLGKVYGKLANMLWEYFVQIWFIFFRDGDLEKFFKVYLWVFALDVISYWVFAFASFYLSFVLLALGLVFLIRMIYLVCLLAVSPIAFLTAGLRTKEIQQIFGGFLNWNEWWKTFLEWSFIAIVLIIWLGIGIKIYEKFPETPLLSLPSCSEIFSRKDGEEIVNHCEEQSALLSKLLPTFVPLLAFTLAVHIGVKTAPGIIKQAVAGIIGVATLIAGAIVAAGTAAVTAGAGAMASAMASAKAAGASRLGALGAGLKAGLKTGAIEGGKVFGGRIGRVLPELRKVLPEEVRPGVEILGAGAEEFEKRVGIVKRLRRPFITERKEVEEEIERVLREEGPRGLLRLAEDRLASREVREGAIVKAMEIGIDKGEEWAKNEEMKERILGIYEGAAKKGDKKTMAMIERRLLKSLAEDEKLRRQFEGTAQKHKMYDPKKEGAFIERIIKGVKTADDVKQLQKGWHKVEEAFEIAFEHFRGPQLSAMREDRDFIEKFSEATEKLIEKIGIEEYIRRRPAQAMYLTGSAAQEFGYTAPPGLTRERIRELRNRWEEEERRRREEEETMRIAMRRMFGRGRGP